MLTFSLGSLSPCYAVDLGEHKSLPPIDASLTGAATESEQPGVSSPVAEGSRAPRLAQLLRKSSGNLEELVRRSGELEPVVQQASSSAEKAAQQASASAQEFVDHNTAKFGENMRKAPADMATKVLHGAAGSILGGMATAAYTSLEGNEIADGSETGEQSGAQLENLQKELQDVSAKLLDSETKRADTEAARADAEAARANAEAARADAEAARADADAEAKLAKKSSWFSCLSSNKTKHD